MANDPVFTTLESTATGKVWWKSKTVLLNVLALLGLMVPAVAQWLMENPVGGAAALSALNLLLRFATKGRITWLSDDEDGGASTGGSGKRGEGGSADSIYDGFHKPISGSGRDTAPGGMNMRQRGPGLPWLVGPACAVMFLASCNPAAWSQAAAMWDAKAVITHTDPDTGNSASVVIRPRRVVEEKKAGGEHRSFEEGLREAFAWNPHRPFRPRGMCLEDSGGEEGRSSYRHPRWETLSPTL